MTADPQVVVHAGLLAGGQLASDVAPHVRQHPAALVVVGPEIARVAWASRYRARSVSLARRAVTLTPLADIPIVAATLLGDSPSTVVNHSTRWSRSGSALKAARTISWSTETVGSWASTDPAASSRSVPSVGMTRRSVRAVSVAAVRTVVRK